MFINIYYTKIQRIVICTLQADDLIEENEYEFRIMAENAVDVGPPCSPTDPILPKDPWSM